MIVVCRYEISIGPTWEDLTPGFHGEIELYRG